MCGSQRATDVSATQIINNQKDDTRQAESGSVLVGLTHPVPGGAEQGEHPDEARLQQTHQHEALLLQQQVTDGHRRAQVRTDTAVCSGHWGLAPGGKPAVLHKVLPAQKQYEHAHAGGGREGLQLRLPRCMGEEDRRRACKLTTRGRRGKKCVQRSQRVQDLRSPRAPLSTQGESHSVKHAAGSSTKVRARQLADRQNTLPTTR